MAAEQNLEEFAYKSIVKLIQENRFRPGDVLLETELSERFGLKSRTPVRHALGQLVASGFLEKRRKKGCFIPIASAEDAKQVFFARECIEGNAAFAAARQANAGDVADLRSIVDKEADTGRSGEKYDYSMLNQRFHETIARISRNSYFQRYSGHLFWRSQVYIFLFGGYYTQKDFVRHMLSPPQHIKIVDAIENRDANEARERMIAHIRFTFERIFTIIQDTESRASYFPHRG
ncbi:MAG: GntR family transcriptional regulator [Pseudomonadota bacterium]